MSNESNKTIAALGEFGLINTLFAPLQGSGDDNLKVGQGDDAAVLQIPRTQQLTVTTDMLMEGVHFSSDADPFLLGQKTVRVNLSDMAAMGANPHWCLLSLALPASTKLSWAEEFARGVKEALALYDVSLIGGDTTASKGCIAINMQMMGLLGQDRAQLRSAAQPGDRVFVSGTIGDSALGLAQRLGQLKIASADDRAYLMRRHQLPEPRVPLGLALQDSAVINACIDVSDGLAADLKHICQASGVSARIDLERVPLSEAARNAVNASADLESLLITGGEDYELLFTVATGAVELLARITADLDISITEIGEILPQGEESRVEVVKHGEPFTLGKSGWTHF
ncbi:thiamine-phosphate kinase [Magnetofaba australis]|uniref:thiamine-phosphate kinase n=1 Tax=Magnetofaba australis TaxID=1472297 RepID=UPI001301BAF7|nr:thiamine-phosphate kinase [Magnetofaba australis]